MNLPNLLTLLRILLVPAFLCALIYENREWALGLFLGAAVTDFFDGLAARMLRCPTLLGSYLDPLADKLLLTVAFIGLAAKGQIPAWLAVITVSKDLYVSLGTGILFLVNKVGPSAVEPSRLGKWCTTLQMATIGLVLLAGLFGLQEKRLQPLFLFTAALTVIAGLHYILTGSRLLPRGKDRTKGSSEAGT